MSTDRRGKVPGGRMPRRTTRIGREPHRIIVARGEMVRCFTLRPWLIASMAGIAVVLAALYLGATAYLIFRDDLIASSLAGQSRLREAYEDRMATLRSQIDQVKSRQAVDHASIEEKVDRLLGRQDALGERQRMLSALADAARRAGFDILPPAPPPKPDPSGKNERLSMLDGNALELRMASATGAPTEATMADRLDEIDGELTRMESEQFALVDAMARKISKRTEKIKTALSGLGVKLPEDEEGVGGPYIPLDETGRLPFHEGVDVLSSQLERLAELRRLALRLPLRRPVESAVTTSRFGARMDPFLGRPAFHAGIDFRAGSGQPVRAAAFGRVTKAEWTGGYGKMVEIDHGNGLKTRYGHLSRILVNEGETVGAGTPIGRVGSTGRSTGPHLHYEVRVNDEAVDPTRYLNAAQKITGLF